ncbi:MAG: dihydroorotase family protein [Thermodesulfobacteriota bacterium]
MELDLMIKDGFLVIPEAGIVKATMGIKEGRVVGIFEEGSNLRAREVIDGRGKYILPGVIQPHAHLGQLEGLEDYATETGSAAVGGTTTVIDFHKGKEDYGEEFLRVKTVAGQKAYVDFSFHLYVMSDVHLEGLPRYVEELGISSFKFQMGSKGEEPKEKGIPALNDGLIYEAFLRLGELKGTIACIHAENYEINAYHTEKLKRQGRDDLRAWSEARPSCSEAESIQRMLYFSEVTQCPLYIVHMTTREGLRLIREHRKKGLSDVYIETCPQYLTHHMNDNLGRRGKFTPPLRTEADNEALWDGLLNGEIDTIGIDQITRKVDPEEKSIWNRTNTPREAVTALPVLITEGHLKRGLPMERIAEITSYHAARIFNLYPKKGTLSIGSDADLVVVDVGLEKKVKKEMIKSLSNFSVYEGRTLRGWPVLTLCRGKVIMRDGEIVGDRGWGVFVERKPGM